MKNELDWLMDKNFKFKKVYYNGVLIKGANGGK